MAMVKVKICGVTNAEDALAAVDMGADLIGFNFFKSSPRYIHPDKALKIIDKLPTYVDTVGVFVNPDADKLKNMVNQGFLNWIQLHGDETPEFCESLHWLNVRTIKAIRVKTHEQIDHAGQFAADAIMLDTFSPTSYGGTGKTFNWSWIGHIHNRVFLAGGITPDNAVAAIERGVYGIDICSGIESEPGKKDHKKMQQLFSNIKYVRE
jgi:phosphoribosylanthranilate isomerase